MCFRVIDRFIGMAKEVVDTTGAGDNFYTGLLTGVLEDMSLQDAGKLDKQQAQAEIEKQRAKAFSEDELGTQRCYYGVLKKYDFGNYAVLQVEGFKEQCQ